MPAPKTKARAANPFMFDMWAVENMKFEIPFIETVMR